MGRKKNGFVLLDGEAMQQMQENAETVFGEMKAGKKSNQDTPSIS